jgi:RNA polymerase Rpb4
MAMVGLSEFEFMQLWNLRPRDYKEAVTLIPTLRHTATEDQVKRAIEELRKSMLVSSSAAAPQQQTAGGYFD